MEDGSWSPSERPDGDGDPAEADSGILQVNERGDDQYFAVSKQFDDVFYPITLAEPGAMYWGYTNEYYERSECPAERDGLKKENIFASCSGLAPVSVSGSLKQLG